jgi:hypothetical protein
MVTRILDTLIENAVNHSKIVATEIIDDILKGAIKTDNNSMKRKHSVTDKTFVTWKEKFPWLCKVEKHGIPYLQCTEYISAASKGIRISSVWGHEGAPSSNNKILNARLLARDASLSQELHYCS